MTLYELQDHRIEIGTNPDPNIALYEPLTTARIVGLLYEGQSYSKPDVTLGQWEHRAEKAGRHYLEVSLEGLYRQEGAEALLQYYALTMQHFPLNIQFASGDELTMQARMVRFERVMNQDEAEQYQLRCINASDVHYSTT